MGPVRITFQHYLIAAAGAVPMVLLHLFREQAGLALGVMPKMMSGLGILAGLGVMYGLARLMGRKTHPGRWPVKLWQRLLALTMLAVGVSYFFAREEIADALNWRVEFGDGLALLVGVIAMMLLLRVLPPFPNENDGGDGDGSQPPS